MRLSEAAFVEAWGARPKATPERAQDIFLAAAIAHRDAWALEWLVGEVRRALRGMRPPIAAQHADEAESRTLALIAVGSKERPARIGAYAATGPLGGWIRVLTIRTARDIGPASGEGFVELESMVLREIDDGAQTSPELELLRGRHRGQLAPALREVSLRMSARDRMLLTLHYLDGVGLEGLGRAYQVHRATVSRWLAAARESFLELCRDELAKRMNVNRLEVDSLVRALESQLEVSLRRLLSPDAH